MKNNDYLLPGLAAIFLAILMPFYWIYELGSVGFDIESAYASSEFGISNFIFLFTGIISVYIYYSFKRILHDHHNYYQADVLLNIMIGLNIVFHVLVFTLDFSISGSLSETALSLTLWLWIGGLIVFGIVDILIAVFLLRASKDLPGLITGFAIMNLIMGIFELSIVFSFAVIFLFPIVALILAVFFLRKPEQVEFV